MVALTTRSGYVGTSALSSVVVRATAYTVQASPAQRSVNSTNANDASAGTGARTIRITYYDGSMNGPLTEDVALNGITAVNTVNLDIQFIESIEVLTVGSGGSNAGVIQLFTTTAGGGSVFGSIATGDNRTFWAHHYVGAGKTCQLSAFRTTATVASGGAILFAAGDPTQASLPLTNLTGTLRHGTTTSALNFVPPQPIVGPNLLIVNEVPDIISVSTAFVSFDFAEA